MSLDYDRGLVVYNPAKDGSKEFLRGNEQITRLAHEHSLFLDHAETDILRSKTADNILGVMRQRDLLLVMGGDGTINQVADALLQAEPDERPDLLAVPIGNANDFSRGLQGRLRKPTALLEAATSSRRIDIHPLQITVRDKEGHTDSQHIAVNNAGFNYTAQVARLLNTPKHRESALRRVPLLGNIARELLTANQGMRHLDTYESYEKGRRLKLADRSLIHGSRAAKYGRFAVSQESDYFLDIVNEHPTRATLIGAGVRMAFAISRAEARTRVSFTTGPQCTDGHVDGETFTISPHSQVEISLSPESFTALAA